VVPALSVLHEDCHPVQQLQPHHLVLLANLLAATSHSILQLQAGLNFHNQPVQQLCPQHLRHLFRPAP
jgi:hypothetical protein